MVILFIFFDLSFTKKSEFLLIAAKERSSEHLPIAAKVLMGDYQALAPAGLFKEYVSIHFQAPHCVTVGLTQAPHCAALVWG
jgi:hypothetical protein